MGRNKWVEIHCDFCGSADYVLPGNVDAQARNHGWIITKDKYDFCSDKCRKEHIADRRMKYG